MGEDCGPETRFEEEFVEEEVCRDIPIKDCKNVQEEVCTEVKEKACEELEMEECDIIPHEECKQVVEKVPKKISKKVTKVVCDNAEEEKLSMMIMKQQRMRFQISMIFLKSLESMLMIMRLV